MAYASSQIKQENITRFCGKKCVQSAKKHPANTRRRPSLWRVCNNFSIAGDIPKPIQI